MAADAPEQRTNILEKLEREMGTCLQQLDRLGLHQAAAHVDMAMAQIRRSRWVRPGRPAFAPRDHRRGDPNSMSEPGQPGPTASPDLLP